MISLSQHDNDTYYRVIIMLSSKPQQKFKSCSFSNICVFYTIWQGYPKIVIPVVILRQEGIYFYKTLFTQHKNCQNILI